MPTWEVKTTLCQPSPKAPQSFSGYSVVKCKADIPYYPLMLSVTLLNPLARRHRTELLHRYSFYVTLPIAYLARVRVEGDNYLYKN